MTLLEFLAALATDTTLMSEFRRSPHETLNSRNVTAEDQRALLAGDPIALRRAVYAEQIAARNAVAHSSTGLPNAEAKPEMVSSHKPGTMPMETPPPHRPGTMPMETPPPHKPGTMPMETPPPHKPDTMPMETPPPHKPDTMPMETPPPHKPGAMPMEGPPPKRSAASLEAGSVHIEPIDNELNLAQDAILAELGVMRFEDQDPCGVWSTKGLTVVGTGIRAGVHMTVESRLAIEQASRVLYLVADPISEACIRKLNPTAKSLWHLYQTGKPRIEIYETIIATILDELESVGDLCVAFYGHAGVLTYPAWESIRRARATGKRARMLPAVSAEDALFADLGIDIGRAGLQSYEATRFMYYKYNFDTSVGLVLWQLTVLGEIEWNPPHAGARPRLEVLAAYLMKFYGPEHEVFLYHAPELPTSRPLIERVALRDLPKAEFISISTLYIPPCGQPRVNEENMRELARIEVRN